MSLPLSINQRPSRRPSARQCLCSTILAVTLVLSQALQAQPSKASEAENSNQANDQGQVELGVQGVALLAAQAYQQNDHARYVELLKKLVEMRPFNGQFRYRLAGGYALLDQKPQALTELVTLQKQGLSYDPAADADFANLAETQAFTYLAEQLKKNSEPFGEADVAFSLERDDLLSESVSFDAKTNRYLVGSVRYGEVIAVDQDGNGETMIEANEDNGLYGVFDIKVDSERRHLWVASASVPHFKGYGIQNAGETGLFQFDLDSGDLIQKIMLENDGQPHLLGNLALASNGDLYATDSRFPVVYKLPAGGKALEVLLTNPGLTSLRGITLSSDESLLYVSDYDLGIFATELSSKEVFGILLNVPVNLSGIDGLYSWGEHLVAIQSGTNPQRIMRFDMSDDGRELIEAQPLLSNHNTFNGPTLGALVGDSIVFVANSQWGAFSGRGEIIAPNELKPLVVLSLDLHLGLAFPGQQPAKESDGVLGRID